MRKSRFSDEKIVAVLKEADSTSVAAAARNHKVSEATIYSWRKHFNGMELSKSVKNANMLTKNANDANCGQTR